jgi:hypothetical protein
VDELPTTFVLQGNNLDAVGSPITSLFPGAVDLGLLAQSPHSLSVQATVINSDYPVIFCLPSNADKSNRPVFSPPVIVENLHAFPRVIDTEPKLVTLHRGATNEPIPTNISIVMVGSGLRQVDISQARVATGIASLARPVEFLGDGIRATLTVSNAGEAISLLLPVPPVARTGATNFIISTPLAVQLDPTNAPSSPKATNSPGPTLEVDKLLAMTTVTISTNASPEAIAGASAVAAAAQNSSNTTLISVPPAGTNSATH